MREHVEKPGDEDEVVNEEAEFHLILRPHARPVEGEPEKEDVDDRKKRGLAEVRAGEERESQRELEEGGDPRERERERDAYGRDRARGHAHIHELESGGHEEDAGDDESRDHDPPGLPERRTNEAGY